MTQGERIKDVRNSLGLTLEKFGEKLGVTKTAISRLEKGERSLTEQMTKSICREFGVDYMWLTTGEGEMFVETDDDFFERIDRIMAGENETRKNMIKMLLYASDDDIKAFGEMMKKASELYSLTRRELILLEMFNMLDDEEQVQRLCSLSGYLLGRKILSEDDSMKYLREIKKD